MIIDKPGTYTIDKPIEAHDRDGIYVKSHDVTLILKAAIIGRDGPGGHRSGVFVAGDGCEIIGSPCGIDGFRWGVRVYPGRHAVVRGLKIAAYFGGISVEGDNALIENNEIMCVGGSTFDAPSRCRGISVYGQRPVIRNNIVCSVRSEGEETLGISIDDKGDSGVIMGNIIQNLDTVHNPGRKSYGIWIGGGTGIVVANNIVQRYEVGIGESPRARYTAQNNAFVAVEEVVA